MHKTNPYRNFSYTKIILRKSVTSLFEVRPSPNDNIYAFITIFVPTWCAEILISGISIITEYENLE